MSIYPPGPPPPIATTATSVPLDPPPIANTGADVDAVTRLALVAVLLGLGLVVAARRRRAP